MSTEELKKYDYIFLIDRSGSMGRLLPNGKSRWKAAEEATEAWARQAEEFDSDGITVITFAETFTEYKNVKGGSGTVLRIFTENTPNGGTNTHTVLEHVFNEYFKSRNTGTAKPILVFVITDGEPSDQKRTAQVIADATKKMNADEEIGIQFLQIGNDADATSFLRMLDDDLQKKYNAKFDIVDTNTFAEAEVMSFHALCEKTLSD